MSDADPTVSITTRRAGTRARHLDVAGRERTTSARVLKEIGVDDGDATDPDALLRQIDETEPLVAMERAIELLGYRERSTHELARRLSDDGYPDSTIAATAARLKELQLLDDSRFSAMFVRTKVKAGWGRHRIKNGLAAAGVADDVREEALLRDYPSDDFQRAYDLARKRPPGDARDERRLIERIVRRGFDYSTARRAVNACASEIDRPGGRTFSD